jgi:hypothetical protein
MKPGETMRDFLRDNSDDRIKYWCVSAGMIGHCGHEHPTPEDAKSCLEPMEKKYRETRWPKKKPKTATAPVL